ncbi:MAG TPA: hypothetical protein VN903_16510, partial [Polyangia bacterium]|nr:hypothetical protein [Polyangia bacterium]
QMSLVKSLPGSNAPDQKGSDEKTSGSLGMVGFTPVDYPSQTPAKSNSDLFANDTPNGLGDDGTNLSAYKDQKGEISPMTGK